MNITPETVEKYGGDFCAIVKAVGYKFSDPKTLVRGQIIFSEESERSNQ